MADTWNLSAYLNIESQTIPENAVLNFTCHKDHRWSNWTGQSKWQAYSVESGTLQQRDSKGLQALENTTQREALGFVLLTKHYLDEQIKNNKMDGARSTYGGEERFIQGIGGETWGKETNWKTEMYMGGYY